MCTPKQHIKREKKLHLSEIYRKHFGSYVKSSQRKLKLSDKHLEAVDSAKSCRTRQRGICHFACPDCGEMVEIYRSCKHRFCARCGASSTIDWSNRMLVRLLDVSHHHIVMTLPKSYRHLSKLNGDKLHNILFRMSAQTVQEWFVKKYGLKIGIVSVLHTAGSDLKYHPHVHMIVSRGGMDKSKGVYHFPLGSYLCKQRDLGLVFRQKFNESLISSYIKGEIKTPSKVQTVLELRQWINRQSSRPWIVNIEAPLSNIEAIIGYVGRYTKRACLSEYKLVGEKDGVISFVFNDYKNTPRGSKPLQSIRSYKATEFLDKLLQHVPTKGYKMVRYYGLYNSAYLSSLPIDYRREEEEILALEEDYDWGEYEQLRKVYLRSGRLDPLYCGYCKKERELIYIEIGNKKLYNDSS